MPAACLKAFCMPESACGMPDRRGPTTVVVDTYTKKKNKEKQKMKQMGEKREIEVTRGFNPGRQVRSLTFNI